MYNYMYIHERIVCETQACLVVARLWSCSTEQMSTDDVNQYLGWTIAQLSRNVWCSICVYYVKLHNMYIHMYLCIVMCLNTFLSVCSLTIFCVCHVL